MKQSYLCLRRIALSLEHSCCRHGVRRTPRTYRFLAKQIPAINDMSHVVQYLAALQVQVTYLSTCPLRMDLCVGPGWPFSRLDDLGSATLMVLCMMVVYGSAFLPPKVLYRTGQGICHAPPTPNVTGSSLVTTLTRTGVRWLEEQRGSTPRLSPIPIVRIVRCPF